MQAQRNDPQSSRQGTILSVRGSVVDAHFPHALPDLYHVLSAGEERKILIEVVSHLDEETVRGIALTPT